MYIGYYNEIFKLHKIIDNESWDRYAPDLGYFDMVNIHDVQDPITPH